MSTTPPFSGGGGGTVFKVNTDGNGFQMLLDFGMVGGPSPHSGLVLSGTTLYGTTLSTVFKLNTDGSGYAVLKTGLSDCVGGLTLFDNTLYGTSEGGGTYDCGTIFKLNTDGSGFAILKSFTGPDGNAPTSDLLLSGTTLYGTTVYGGPTGPGYGDGYGVVFSLSLAPILGSPALMPNGHCSLSFHGFAGVTYAIESAPDASGPWIVLTNLVVPTNGIAVYEDQEQPLSQRKFYRVGY